MDSACFLSNFSNYFELSIEHHKGNEANLLELTINQKKVMYNNSVSEVLLVLLIFMKSGATIIY